MKPGKKLPDPPIKLPATKLVVPQRKKKKMSFKKKAGIVVLAGVIGAGGFAAGYKIEGYRDIPKFQKRMVEYAKARGANLNELKERRVELQRKKGVIRGHGKDFSGKIHKIIYTTANFLHGIGIEEKLFKELKQGKFDRPKWDREERKNIRVIIVPRKPWKKQQKYRDGFKRAIEKSRKKYPKGKLPPGSRIDDQLPRTRRLPQKKATT